MLEPVEVEPPKLLKGESVLNAVERHRQRCRTLRADIHTIESSSFPAAYCRKKMRAQIETLAQRGAVNVSRLVEHDGDIEFPTLRLRALVHNATPGAVVFHEAADTVALTCWLHKDALIKRLDAEIDAEADDKNALSPEMREQRAAAVQLDLLAAERSESAAVWASEGQIEHRSDISVPALLGVRLVCAPRAAALPPTSPSMTIDVARPGRR